jgi:hypothetical protein
MYRRQNVGQKHDIKVSNKFFENGVKLKYLGMTAKNQNCIHQEI